MLELNYRKHSIEEFVRSELNYSQIIIEATYKGHIIKELTSLGKFRMHTIKLIHKQVTIKEEFFHREFNMQIANGKFQNEYVSQMVQTQSYSKQDYVDQVFYHRRKQKIQYHYVKFKVLFDSHFDTHFEAQFEAQFQFEAHFKSHYHSKVWNYFKKLITLILVLFSVSQQVFHLDFSFQEPNSFFFYLISQSFSIFCCSSRQQNFQLQVHNLLQNFHLIFINSPYIIIYQQMPVLINQRFFILLKSTNLNLKSINLNFKLFFIFIRKPNTSVFFLFRMPLKFLCIYLKFLFLF
ncbi:transmembrane protein, putative (macronuclear) [Tetrahymena thermophila SB210]|uniref:Transmembrane protein, putative n=1 Tax=Tetrahymena thermophila (strain SB210) TaxID=312017 RepID=W7XBR1_TETTS|nr:transmembrane protein, putative [Tetrahymena thermophila SB210]EWS73848.1 transmembrane protein, putative [Tetrahymena thermophila SB210]|eukprot:XP_012653595.1 transmembrane protein, putative [Tetrahymena thermophila SB210]